jgi:hypothetical protein
MISLAYILEILFLSVALSMDSFTVSITCGLQKTLTKKRTFVLAFSFAFFYGKHEKQSKTEKFVWSKASLCSVCAGACFGMASMLNTLLAGRLPSTLIFPTYNVGLMMMSLIFGIILFKEKPNKGQLVSFGLGIATILALSF